MHGNIRKSGQKIDRLRPQEESGFPGSGFFCAKGPKVVELGTRDRFQTRIIQKAGDDQSEIPVENRVIILFRASPAP